jgi:hypothetical protein
MVVVILHSVLADDDDKLHFPKGHAQKQHHNIHFQTERAIGGLSAAVLLFQSHESCMSSY